MTPGICCPLGLVSMLVMGWLVMGCLAAPAPAVPMVPARTPSPDAVATPIARQGLPLSFDLSPTQAERGLREAGWSVAPTQTATVIFAGPPGESFSEVEHPSMHATRDGWYVNASYEWSPAVSFARISPPLPSEAAVTAMMTD